MCRALRGRAVAAGPRDGRAGAVRPPAEARAARAAGAARRAAAAVARNLRVQYSTLASR